MKTTREVTIMNKNNTAVVFPGQGTQRHGMGQDFVERFSAAKDTFEEASDALGWDVSAMCFGDDPRLHLTEFAQPCILTTEIAMFRSLVAQYDFCPSCFGGHSLGEYTALTAAGVMPLGDAVNIVHARGKLMQQACPEGTGGMAAVIADELSPDELEPVVDDLQVDIANINAKTQIVLSGDRSDLGTVEKRLKVNGRFSESRFVGLDVSAAFHSRFMTGITEKFKDILNDFSGDFEYDKADKVTSNVSGGFHEKKGLNVLDSLTRQVNSPVLWRNNMDSLASRCDTILELGPARPLTAFFKSQDISCTPLTSAKKSEKFFTM